MRAVVPALVLLSALVAAMVGPAAGADAAVVITIGPDGRATATASSGTITLRDEEVGARYTFDLELAGAYTTAEVRVHGGVDVVRPRQLVPEVDDSAQHPDAEHLHPHFFVDVARDVADVDHPAHIVNFTGDAASFTTHLGFIGPGTSVLTLTRDVEAPFYQIDAPTDLSDNSFLVVARSDEFAYGDLQIWPLAGGDIVPNPIPVPTLEHTFPVQGLRPNTTYAYHIVFTDWAGNTVTSDVETITTLEKVDAPRPVLIDREPEPDSTVPPGSRVSATFKSLTPIHRDGFQFFLDKRPTRDGLRIEAVIGSADEYTLVYAPGAPSETGRHTVGFDAINAAGGKAAVTWRFYVEEDRPVPGLDTAAAAVAVVGLALAARLRSGSAPATRRR